MWLGVLCVSAGLSYFGRPSSEHLANGEAESRSTTSSPNGASLNCCASKALNQFFTSEVAQENGVPCHAGGSTRDHAATLRGGLCAIADRHRLSGTEVNISRWSNKATMRRVRRCMNGSKQRRCGSGWMELAKHVVTH